MCPDEGTSLAFDDEVFLFTDAKNVAAGKFESEIAIFDGLKVVAELNGAGFDEAPDGGVTFFKTGFYNDLCQGHFS